MNEILNSFESLASLSDQDRKWLLQVGYFETLAPGSVLIREGEAIAALYVLTQGKLEVVTSCTDSVNRSGGGARSRTQVIGQVTAGQILGEISFVTQRVPIATLNVLDTAEVLVIPHQELVQQLQQNRAFAANFYQIIAQLLSQRLQQNDALSTSSDAVPIPPLRKVLSMFAVFEDTDLNWFLSVGKKQKCDAGTVLVREKESVEAVYILIDGELEVSIHASEQGITTKKVLTTLMSGEIIGEISFVVTGSASATVTCLRRTLVLALPHETLATHLQANVGFAARFYQAIAIVLGDRIRDRLLQYGYGQVAFEQGQSLETEMEYADELDLEMLEQTTIAGSRFDWFMQQVQA